MLPGPRHKRGAYLRQAQSVGREATPWPVHAMRMAAIAKPGSFALVAQEEALHRAFGHLRRNGGPAAGVDGQTLRQFARAAGAEIHRLARELWRGEYSPMPTLRVEVEKDDGGTRPLDVPTIRDRVVGRAAAEQLVSGFPDALSPDLYGHVTGFGHRRAREVAAALARKYRYAAVVDFANCFGTIQHYAMRERFRRLRPDGALFDLVVRLVTADIVIDGEVYIRDVGIAQGSPPSPWLMNLYLTDFSRELRARFGRHAGCGDDIVFFSDDRRQLERYLTDRTRRLRDDLGLAVHPHKSRVVDLRADVLEYLGYEFTARGARPPLATADKIATAVVAAQGSRRRRDVLRGRVQDFIVLGQVHAFLARLRDRLPEECLPALDQVVTRTKLAADDCGAAPVTGPKAGGQFESGVQRMRYPNER